MQTHSQSLWSFLGVFFLVFFLSATALYMIDFVPEPKSASDTVTAAEVRSQSEYVDVPVRIRIPRIGVDTSISNPQSSDLAVLDDALLNGAVRYPGSAYLGESRPMFLFGHQSGLPVVRNQAFKAFNDLQLLEPGDSILVYSEGAVYEYATLSVTKVRAEEALIPLDSDDRTLILSTCNSFGDPGERYVVKAEFITKTTL